jgi:ATP-dependent Clp protease adaptor protein ClpS
MQAYIGTGGTMYNIVHYKGKCTVKTGSMDLLKPMHEKLLSRELTSEIV